MQSTTTSKETTMFKKQLTRLAVMVVTGSILVATYADLALAVGRWG
jgi:hypothetical protein